MQKYTKKGTNMNRKELSQNHWKYYLMLEKRFVESIEFVELHEEILMHFLTDMPS